MSLTVLRKLVNQLNISVAGSPADDGVFIPDSWPSKTISRNADETIAYKEKVVDGVTYRQTFTRNAAGNVTSETNASGIAWIKQ